MNPSPLPPPDSVGSVAIIGLAGRFPGAPDVTAFWENLRQGVESISFFSKEELAASGVDPELLDNPNYVRARSVLEGIELCDADFFGYSPREAEAMDPQQRLFLEGAWEALEDAGYDTERYDGSIGVYAGLYMNTYLLANLCSSREFIEGLLSFKRVGAFQTFLGNDKDYLTTRVAYKLNLKGPAITVQTACSTSLVAVCQAYQSLVNHQCDIALAGGITVMNPQRKGYLYQEGGMLSPDGHCRAFDAQAQGTVFGNGMGIVVLKRLADALADRDHIHAVIRGAALNNDGAVKVSYTAPSVDGQTEVITLAQALAGVEAASIGYVEAHGTGTPLGDPIEIAALTQAFRASTPAKGFCGIGSVKTNIGHLDVAAGVAGLIKTTLALQHKTIPPSLNFSVPNPKIDFADSPFYVVNQLTEWKDGPTPRRAAVSSFGVGGTNAHVVLEEAPSVLSSSATRPWQLLVLSARTASALDAATVRLAARFKADPTLNLADAAFTLQTGRRRFNHRRTLVCHCLEDAVKALEKSDPKRVFTQQQEQRDAPVTFLFPGQGAQSIDMGRELYQHEAVFREELDRCVEILKPILGLNLKEILYPNSALRESGETKREVRSSVEQAFQPVGSGDFRVARADGGLESPQNPQPGKAAIRAGASSQLDQTRFTQPALFVVEYALAKLWMSWGVKPQAMIGHSVGEYVAACLAGVFSLETALLLVAERARLVQEQPGGAMLAVRLREEDLLPLLDERLSIAAINAPSLCVVSGSFDAVENLELRLKAQGIAGRRLQTSHAFHSAMMDPVVGPFSEVVGKIELRAPQIPYVSTLTGNWITAAEATDPHYWASHLRRTVRFADALATLCKSSRSVLLESGPGQTLTNLARQNPSKPPDEAVVGSLAGPGEKGSEMAALLNALGQLWLAGVTIDWAGFYAREERRRVKVPTYPFERKRHWIEAPHHRTSQSLSEKPVSEEASGAPVSPNFQPGAPKPTKESLMSQPQAFAPKARKDRVLAVLKTLLHELSGIDLAGKDASATFLELGFDSLFLTQARQSLQSKFGVKLTYRQLSEDLSNLDALAAYIDAHLAPDAFPDELAPSPSVLTSSPSGPTPISAEPCCSRPAPGVIPPEPANARALSAGSSDLLERIVNQQLQAMAQLMAQQLAALRGGSAGATPEASPTPLESATPTPARSVGGSPLTPDPLPDRSVSAPAISHNGSARIEPKPFGPFRPIAKSSDGSLTPEQQKYFNQFVERYTKRTANSKRLAQEFRHALADPRSVAGFRKLWKELVYQIVVESSSGSKLWDVDGNEYIDVTNGFGVNLFGHRPDFVTEAIQEQLRQGVQIGPQLRLAGEVAELIREFTGMERVTFCNTGSEAVMAALRMARTVTGRSKIAFFSGDYHGMFDEVLLRPNPTNWAAPSLPIAPGIPRNVGEEVLILDYGTPESLDHLQAEANNLAAILVEPVQSRRPEWQPREFLHELRKLTEASGTVLIFDEVITGFRVHPRGAQGWFGIQADLATYGKVIGGGLPIGALAGKAACLDCLDGGFWQFGDDSSPEADMTFFAGTFVRHPLALAAAKAVLLHLKEKGSELQAGLNRSTTDMAEELNRFFASQQLPIQTAHFGSLFRFHFPPDLPHVNLLFYHILERGIYIRETHQNCFLTTAHSAKDIARIIQAVKDSVAELQEAEFFRAPAEQVFSQDRSENRISGNTGYQPVPSGNLPDGTGVASEAKTDAGIVPTLTAIPERNSPTGAGKLPAPPFFRTGSQNPQTGKTAPPALAACPLTEAQKEIWVACQIDPEVSCAYNESFTARLRGELDKTAIEKALGEIVVRHDALRTTFSPDGSTQKVAPALRLEVPWIDWSSDGAAVREAKVAAIPAEEANRPFDLVNGPLVRVRIVRLEPQVHLLVFTAHHLVCDGWSSNVILNELSQLYTAFSEKKKPQLPPPPSYGEYVRLEAESQRSPDGKTSEAWWREQFATPVPPLELPTDHPRDAQLSKRGATRRKSIDTELYRSLKGVGAQHGATLFSVLAAAFKTLLHRLSGQDEIVIGIFSAGQARLGRPGLVGHCVNMLPVRSRLDGHLAFAEYLARLKSIVLDAQEHEDCTFGRLLQQLKLPREPGRLPLVEVVFNLEPKETGLQFGGLEAEVDQNPQGFVNFDLFLNVNDTGDGLILDFEYNTSLFGQYTIDRWLGHYETLLRGIVAQPREPIGQLPLLTDAERRQLVIDWNDTAAGYPSDACLHTLIEERVDQAPEALALISDSGERSYRELNRNANQLARHLLHSGIGPGQLIGICLERSVEMVTAMLGILKAGAAYVWLDPTYPKDRLSFLIQDARLPVVLTLAKHLEALPEPPPATLRVVCLDTDAGSIANESPENPIGRAQSRDLAYVIYTSGTTGRPKGVEVEHRSIVNHLCWRLRAFPLTPSDRCLQKASASFDISVWEIFGSLLAGVPLVLAKPGGEHDARYLAELIVQQRVTHAHFGPAMLRLILDEPGFNQGETLRRVFCGGEPLPAELQERFLERCPAVELYSQYGPTEATVDATCCRCSAIAKYPRAPIGRPIDNMQAYILDRHQQPVPIGVVGELHLGGVGIARGYLNQPALTAEKFLRNPFRDEPGARLFRTGDRARFRPDGHIEFLGRLDQQLKIRGFRVEPEEIQAVLAEHPSVRESVVVAHDDPVAGRRLVAYIVPAESASTSRHQGAETEWLSDLVTQFDTGYGAAIEEASRQSKTNQDPTFNIYAWSGLENTAEEVNDWIERIASTLLAFRPKRLLEIGCGTGMVLTRLAPHCQEFWGTDLSQAAIDDLNRRLRERGPEFNHVKLLRRMADDFTGLPAGAFDGVILNAVVEYFPGVDYLLKVLDGALQALAPGGFIFLGDVPNLALHETYHIARQLLEADPAESTAKIRQRAQLRLADDARLLLAPDFWRSLPGDLPQIRHVEVQLIQSRFHNELSKLLADTHYNVVLHTAATDAKPESLSESIEWLDWRKDQRNSTALAERLAASKFGRIGLTQVEHGRVRQRLKAVELLSGKTAPPAVQDLKAALDGDGSKDALLELQRWSETIPWSLEVTWSKSGNDGLCDVVLVRDGLSEPERRRVPVRERGPFQPPRGYANNPMQTRLARKWIPQWRQYLERALPDYMIPSAYVLLERLPLTRAGKLDRRALPAPEYGRAAIEETYLAPRTTTEEALCEIWTALLGVQRVGVHDNFFELGGHSLLAIQVLSRLRQTFSVDLPMNALFEQPTVARLAAAIEEMLAAEIDALSEDEAQRYVKTV